MSAEQLVITSSEKRPERSSTLEQLGLHESTPKKTGLTTAPVRTFAHKMEDGSRLFGLTIDYPVVGMRLLDVLNSLTASPADVEVLRFGTIADWLMPRRAEMGFEEDIRLDRAHSRIPGYNEFNAGHRSAWIRATARRDGDNFFCYEEGNSLY